MLGRSRDNLSGGLDRCVQPFVRHRRDRAGKIGTELGEEQIFAEAFDAVTPREIVAERSLGEQVREEGLDPRLIGARLVDERAMGVAICERERRARRVVRWEEQPSELQSLMRISYPVFRLKKK